MWQLQAPPGAPGTARQGRTRTIMLVNRGGVATPPRAPGHGRPPAAPPAGGHDCLSAVPSATAPVPVHVYRLRQEFLPRVPVTPNTLTASHSHRLDRHSRYLAPLYRHSCPPSRHSRESGNPSCSSFHPDHPASDHQVHPATQVPPRPRSCSTAGTGYPHPHPARAPPSRPPTENLPLPAASSPRRGRPPKTYPRQPLPPSPHGGEGPGVRHVPSPSIDSVPIGSLLSTGEGRLCQ